MRNIPNSGRGTSHVQKALGEDFEGISIATVVLSVEREHTKRTHLHTHIRQYLYIYRATLRTLLVTHTIPLAQPYNFNMPKDKSQKSKPEESMYKRVWDARPVEDQVARAANKKGKHCSPQSHRMPFP